MKIEGQNEIAAAPEDVWKALNDADVLRQAIPGCESLDKISDTRFKATIITKVGPIKAKFSGEVTLSDLDPPNGYTLSGKGSAGSIGNARGSARVKLEPLGEGTLLTYVIDAQVTGKLAQLGSRLIQSTTKVLAAKFFKSFQDIVGGAGDAVSGAEAAAPAAGAGKSSRMIWMAGSGLAVIALIAVWWLNRAG